ncbi:MAG: ATP-binding cassette transporter [Trebouxia sp. A1-2]|nr:MAG: ATP-binding cassette transporter [Trebouxia sp. A1-2]
MPQLFLGCIDNTRSAYMMQKRLLITPAPQNGKRKDNSDQDAAQDGKQGSLGKGGQSEVVDLRNLSRPQRQQIVDNALATNEQSNEVLLQRYADRADKVGVDLPTAVVRFEGVNVSSQVSVGSRSLPTLPNSVLNFCEDVLTTLRLKKSSKRKFDILKDLSGSIQPGRLTLMMGPPGGGKSTLLQLLAGMLAGHAIKVSGEVTYNGQPLSSFLPQRTAAYVPQEDAHIAKLTVQETLDFSARCQGTGIYQAMLSTLREREKKNGVKPDSDLDAFMKAQATEGKNGSVNSELVLRLLGLQECKDTLVGDDIIRGVSGGQRKRVTTGEMMVGPRLVMMMDEISTGLDSSTTFQMVQSIRHLAHLQRATICVALLQPAPEVFDLFDDIMVLAEGRMVYHGPREQVVPFFDGLGFQIPERKGVADFIQEICSEKDQEQYWAGNPDAYEFVGVSQLAEAFQRSGISSEVDGEEDLEKGKKKQESSADKGKGGRDLDPLVHEKYALTSFNVFKACLRREYIIMKRNWIVFSFRVAQLIVLSVVAGTLLIRPIMYTNSVPDGQLFVSLPFAMMVGLMMDNFSEMSITLESMHVMFRQRANCFYPGWAYAMPTTLLRIPYSFLMAFLLSCIIYWVVGYDSNPGRFFSFMFLFMLAHQYALSLFRLIAALTRSIVMAYTLAWLIFLLHMLLGGFLLPKRFIHPWVIGGYWALPLQYIQNAIAINELTGGVPYPALLSALPSLLPADSRTMSRWKKPNPADPATQLGRAVLDFYNFRHDRLWVWLAFAVTIAWILLLNLLLLLAFSYLPAPSRSHGVMPESAVEDKEARDQGKADTRALQGQDQGKPDLPVASPTNGGSERKNHDKQSNGHQQALVTPQIVNSVEGTANGHQTADDTSNQVEGMPADEHQHGRHQASDARLEPQQQQAASQRDSGQPPNWNFASRRESANPQSHQDASPGNTGHPQQSGASPERLSSRRRSMERPSASLTLPFEQLNFVFHHINYSVPATSPDDPRNEGADLMLLRNVSGAFRPHQLACLMGASGAGKTTLMDCLAGRKTRRTNTMFVGGMQNDIHAPATTVYEALEFSAQMRVMDIDKNKLKDFVDQVVELMELESLVGALVGTPGQSGLSVEQRKRLTIGVELCANPSVIFMDEPTSGLDARAAAIVMRTVRNTVNTGRTVVCTIHQPSIDIFESFDELVLLKPGGRVIYCGPTGHNSKQLVQFFQSLDGVPRIQEGINPATWMLEVTRPAEERRLGLDFAEVYQESDLFSQNLLQQFRLLLLRNSREYWRMPDYNTVRIYFTCLFGLVLGAVYWRIGKQRTTPEGIGALCGALLIANIFLGTSNSSTVQPIVGQQRSILYRERAAGYYATYPFALAQFLIEIPYVLAQSVFFSVITYFMIYFYIDAAKFFWYFFFVFLNLLFFTSWGIIAVALTPNIQVSAVLSSGVYTFWLIWGGFIVPRPQIHGWWIWYYFLDPLAYTIWGLIGSQLSDVSDVTILSQTGMSMPLDQYMTTTYKFRHPFIGAAAGILIAFIVLFHVATAFALRKLNYLKR